MYMILLTVLLACTSTWAVQGMSNFVYTRDGKEIFEMVAQYSYLCNKTFELGLFFALNRGETTVKKN